MRVEANFRSQKACARSGGARGSSAANAQLFSGSVTIFRDTIRGKEQSRVVNNIEYVLLSVQQFIRCSDTIMANEL